MIVLKHTQRTARRAHKHPCFACGLAIVPGDAYWDTRLADEGRAWACCTHKECEEVVALFRYYDGEGWPYRVLVDYEDWEELPEWWREWYTQRAKMGPFDT